MKDLITIWVKPAEVFEQKPAVWIPFLGVIVVALIAVMIAGPVTFQIALERAQEAMAKAGKEFEGFTYNRFLATTLIATLIIVPVKILLQGLVYNIFMPLFGGVGEYTYGVLVATFASWISGIGTFLKSILIRVTQTPQIHFDLSVFLPKSMEMTYLYKVLVHVDLFTLWALVVSSVGLSVLYQVERKKTYGFVFGVWILYILIFSLIPGGKA